MNTPHLAVVLLSPLEGDYSLIFEHKVAGVPIFKRLLLTLQKAGIKEILVLSHQLDEKSITAHQQSIEKDSRFKTPMHWHDHTCFFEKSDSDQVNALTQSQPFLAVNGNLVTHQKVIQRFIELTNCKSSDKVLRLESKLDSPGVIRRLPSSQFFALSHSNELEIDEELVALSSGTNFGIEVQNNTSALVAEGHLLKSVGLNNDSFMDRVVTRFISRQLTRLFLKTPLTPNQITFLSLMIGLGSAFFFYQGTFFSGITGALLLLVSAWVDCTDGEIARLKFMETPWGARFDILCDNIVHCIVFFTIGMGLFFSTGDAWYKLYGGLAVFGSLVSFLLLSGIIVRKKQEASQGNTTETTLADQIANRDFTYFLFVMACIGRLDIFILLTAIGSNIFALYLIIKHATSKQ